MKYKFKVGDRVIYKGPDGDCWSKFSPGVVVDGKYGLGVFFDNYDYYSESDYHDTPPWHDLEIEQQKTPTESTAEVTEGYDLSEYTTGKVASDGGPSAYYDFPEGCSTLNDLIEYKNMSFAQGNIFKAAYRLGNKEGISLEYDLKKIKYYADRMLNQIGKE